MNYLSFSDWVVITIYLLAIIGLGVWFGKDQKNTRDYFLGSKNIPWWGIGLSIVAAETSALTIIGVPAIAYGGNIAFIQLIIGYVIARLVLAVVMVPHYLKGEIYSPYQLFANAFGSSASRTAGGFFLLSETLAAGVRVYVACIPIQLMLGIQVLPAIVLFVVLSLLYTYVGGVKAVIWTDAVQFGLFLAGGIFTLLYIPHFFEGGIAEVFRTAMQAGKLHWLNAAPPASQPLGFGQIAKWVLEEPMNIWMGIIGGTVMVMSSHGAEQLIVQRVLACKNVRDGRKALCLSAVVVFPLFFIFLLTGVMLWVYFQKFPMLIQIPEPRPGIKANDFIYPIFMLTAVPHYLKGFLIVAILSAAMSSVSSALTSLASVSTMDFVKGLSTKNRSEAFYLTFSKVSTIFWAAVLIFVAYLTREVTFVLDAAFKLRGLTSGALLGGLFLAVFWKQGRARPLIIGMLCSLGTMIAISPMVQANLPKDWYRLSVTIAFPWYTLIGAIITLGVTWVADKLIPRRAAEPFPTTVGNPREH
ncbi:MAG TPA: sodium:solute symporter [Candidatus Saccharimonadales bacterium]|nr:sodium:solute symporter [Candidatus Saccharimonadales bacterium]